MKTMKVKLQIGEDKIIEYPKQNTFILMWNPGISSYTMERFENDLVEMVEFGPVEDLDWNLRDWEQAGEGDRFFMVRVGEGTTGIVMSGCFSTEPYEGEDWSGKGRQLHYMGLEIESMIHPERSPIITPEQLAAAIPGFDWTGGPSGRILDAASAEKLEQLWKEYLDNNRDIFEPRASVYFD